MRVGARQIFSRRACAYLLASIRATVGTSEGGGGGGISGELISVSHTTTLHYSTSTYKKMK